LPPSRMAKRTPSSMAIGTMSSTSIFTLSPGEHISTPPSSFDRAGHVGGAEVELRTIAGEERRVTAAFLLRQHVHLALELLVGLDRARLGQHLAALDCSSSGHAAEEQPTLSPACPLSRSLLEHLDAGDGRLLGVFA